MRLPAAVTNPPLVCTEGYPRRDDRFRADYERAQALNPHRGPCGVQTSLGLRVHHVKL